MKLLEDETDALAAKAGQFLIAKAVNVLAIISQDAGGWLIQPGQKMEKCALTAA